MSRRLRDVVEGASLGRFELFGEPDDATIEITAVDYDSRNVKPGSLFCCLRGANSDGHDRGRLAAQRGTQREVIGS